MTYTSTTNTTPAYGQEGPSVSALQTQLNTQNAGKAGWVPLTVDGKYGPKTQAAATWKPGSQLVVTSGPARAELSKYSSALDSALTQFGLGNAPQVNPDGTPVKADPEAYSDAYTQSLDTQAKSSDDATKAMIATIQSQDQSKRNQLDAQYDNYKRGLALLGIQHNDAQSTPDLLLGHEQQAQNEYSTKVNALDLEERKAMMDAASARDAKKTQIVKEKMDYVKQIQKEKKAALTDLYSQISKQKTASADEAHAIYETLQKLSPGDQQAFIQEVSKKFGIPLGTLVTALADERTKRAKAAGKGTTAKKGYAWGTPPTAERSKVEKYLAAKSDDFDTDASKVKTDQKFYYYVLDLANNE